MCSSTSLRGFLLLCCFTGLETARITEEADTALITEEAAAALPAGKYKIEARAPNGRMGPLAAWGLEHGAQNGRDVKWHDGSFSGGPSQEFYITPLNARQRKYKIEAKAPNGRKGTLAAWGLEHGAQNGREVKWGDFTFSGGPSQEFYITSLGQGKFKIEARAPNGRMGALAVWGLENGAQNGRGLKWGDFSFSGGPSQTFYITRLPRAGSLPAGKYKIEARAPNGRMGALAVWGLEHGAQNGRGLKWGDFSFSGGPSQEFYITPLNAWRSKYKIEARAPNGRMGPLAAWGLENGAQNGREVKWGDFSFSGGPSQEFYITPLGQRKYKIEARAPNGRMGPLTAWGLEHGAQNGRDVKWGDFSFSGGPSQEFYITRLSRR